MKIKLEINELIENQNKTKERCVELIGGGVFSISNLENIIEALKKVNEILMTNSKTKSIVNSKTAGGSLKKIEVPMISQGELYKNNQYLIIALKMQIDILNANNLNCVSDFNFTDEQIINYWQKTSLNNSVGRKCNKWRMN